MFPRFTPIVRFALSTSRACRDRFESTSDAVVVPRVLTFTMLLSTGMPNHLPFICRSEVIASPLETHIATHVVIWSRRDPR